ncbi:MAG: hypothetical protein GX963_12705 [Bacteroidales bacterium]|nr:hypothetical protein [Bacteroidales bacterium]
MGGNLVEYNLRNEIKKLIIKYPEFSCTENSKGFQIEGIFHLFAKYKDVPIRDDYEMKMLVPSNFPEELPKVYELGGRIPRGFEHVFTDDSLCLGIPMEIRKSLAENSSLVGFVDKYIVSYFYAASYYRKYGTYPYGDRKHGIPGIYQYYFELFTTESKILVRQLLWLIYGDNYRGHKACPCGSSVNLRNCHGEILLAIIFRPELKQQAIMDLLMIVEFEEVR